MAPANPKPPTSASACPAPAKPRAAPFTSMARTMSPWKVRTTSWPLPFSRWWTLTSRRSIRGKPWKSPRLDGDCPRHRMKLLVRSLVIAVLIGVLVGFADYVASVHGASKYDPPISEEEGRQLRDLPIAKAEALIAPRRRILTREQWVLESVGY